MRIDVHQHLWTEPLLERLAARGRLPFVRQIDGLIVLSSAGEQPYVIDPAATSAAARAEILRRDGLDRALLALSSPIGIEALPRPEADELIAAHLDGVNGAGPAFGAWGPLALDGVEPGDVDAVLARGCVGVSLPAGALGGAEALAELAPVLARIAERGVPLFVHPGPGRGPRPAELSLGDPFWWPALTTYVAQMQAAWLTFASAGRREHPELKIVFAMLAGTAPFQAERLTLRGGVHPDLRDPLTFYDTSGYGPAAVEMAARLVGPGQLLYGSDRPVVAEPPATGRERALQENAAPLFARAPVAA